MNVELAGKYRAQWGEGPLWWKGKLYYVDIEGCRVVEFTPQSGEEKCWHVGERVGSVVPRDGGGFVVAGDSGFGFLDAESGEVRAVGDPEAGKASPLALQLCRKIQESEDWEDDIEEIVEDFSAETGRTPFYTVCFY